MGPVPRIGASGMGPVRDRVHGGAGRLVAVLLVLVPVLLATAFLVLARWAVPSDGTVTGQASTRSWRPDGLVVEQARSDNGLRTGDVVVAVQGVPVSRAPALPPARVGEVLLYTVERAGPDGGARRVEVPVTVGRYPLGRALAASPGMFVAFTSMLVVAALVVHRRPRLPAARALYAIAVLMALTPAAFPLPFQVLEIVTGRVWPFLVSDGVNCVLWGVLLHFALVFPDRPRAPRRWLVAAAYLVPPMTYAVRLAVLLPRREVPLLRFEALVHLSPLAARVQPVLVLAAFVAAWVTTPDGPARRRIRWALATFGLCAIGYLLLGQLPSAVAGAPLLPWDVLALLFVPFPVALGVAVLRYGLFDVQVIVRRSLVLGAVTAVLALLYALVVAGLGRLGVLPPAAAPFLGAVAVALLFGPVRSRARTLVSRSFFGDRDDPVEVLQALGARLAATGSSDTVLPALVETLARTLHLSYAAVRLRGGVGAQVTYGERSGAALVVPVVLGGEQVGELELDPGPAREPFGDDDARLVGALARQLGVVSQNLLLENRLRDSLQRVVTAREEERRRLRRDLHDGLGPTLAANGLQLRVAADLVGSDPDRARRLLADLADANREAVAGLRRLVDGLRPPVLDRLGLVGAVEAAAEGFATDDGLRITVVAGVAGVGGQRVPGGASGIGVLPAAVEVAAYRVVVEALTNVVRHAGARSATVRLERVGGDLLVEVEDDGVGLPVGYTAGVGIAAVRERALELGGDASVTPGPAGGTVVRARLPVRDG